MHHRRGRSTGRMHHRRGRGTGRMHRLRRRGAGRGSTSRHCARGRSTISSRTRFWFRRRRCGPRVRRFVTCSTTTERRLHNVESRATLRSRISTSARYHLERIVAPTSPHDFDSRRWWWVNSDRTGHHRLTKHSRRLSRSLLHS